VVVNRAPFGNAYAVSVPYRLLNKLCLAAKLLKILALPTGLHYSCNINSLAKSGTTFLPT
jgi:hypothetical protein